MKKTVIKSIPGKDQRYPTCGDYWEDKEKIHIAITEQDNEDYEFLIMIHELIEFHLTKKRGISEEKITRFDLLWEEKKGRCETTADEPGNEPGCIYAKEHRFAENIERQIAHEMGLDWHIYNDNLKT